MVRSEAITVLAEEGVAVPKWRQVFSKTYPDARTYKGKCTHEDVAFLVDPLKLLTDWQKWAKETLAAEVEAQYAGRALTPLRLKIYVGTTKVLFGLIEYPAIRVESWHHGSPSITLILALIIGAVIVIWAFLAWLFKEAEEVDWTIPAIGLALIVVIALIGAAKRERR